MPAPSTTLAARLQAASRALEQQFVDKQEIVRLLLISAVAGEHLLLVGPPGTAKSALVRGFARQVDARYFEYLLTRFTEPNELFGPVDIRAFREGTYTRRTGGMLPEAEIVFLDEIFKSNSAILNSLLTVMNERRWMNGAEVVRVPLLSVYGASNEVPNDDNLAALFDRFLLRVVSDNLDSYHFNRLVEHGLKNELAKMNESQEPAPAVVAATELREVHRTFEGRVRFGDEFLAAYKALVFQIRSEGVSLSDRRVVKLLKLFAASAILDGRSEAHEGDLFLLKHVWNQLDQAELLEQLVAPVVDRFHREHPEAARFGGGRGGASLDEILDELGIIRELLTSGRPLSDVQLFSQLKNLNEIRAALLADDGETAQRMVREVDALLESVFASSRFA
jgi:MoxR-like ATPase